MTAAVPLSRRRSGGPARRPGMASRARRLGALGLAGGSLVAAGLLCSTAGQAQTAREEAVMSRARPDFDPIGIEIFFDEDQPGPPITIFPTIALRSGYDTNVFREREDEKSDLFWEISPKLLVTNTGQDLGLEAGISATVRRNLEYVSNDFEDYDVYGQASYFFLEDSDVTGQIGFSRLHEDRSDPDSTGPGENINQYNRYRAIVSSRNRFSDFMVNPQAQVYAYDYLEQDDRDYVEMIGRVRGGYEFEPGYVAFVEPGANLRRYDQEVDSTGANRDSWGWDLRVGLTYNVSSVTGAEVYAGYFQQRYEDPTLADASGLTYGLNLVWNPLDTLTVNAGIDRSVQESTLAGVSSTVVTAYTLGLDYEVRDNLMLTSSGGITTSDFEGSTRNDFSWNAGAGIVYLVNEFAQAGLQGRYSVRDSNQETNNYTDTVIEANLTLQY